MISLGRAKFVLLGLFMVHGLWLFVALGNEWNNFGIRLDLPLLVILQSITIVLALCEVIGVLCVARACSKGWYLLAFSSPVRILLMVPLFGLILQLLDHQVLKVILAICSEVVLFSVCVFAARKSSQRNTRDTAI